MDSSKFNLVKNVRFSIIGFVINILLVFVSYKLVIVESGIEAVGLWATLMAWTSLIRIGDVGMANASLRFVAMRDSSSEDEKDIIRGYIDTGLLTNIMFFAVLGLATYLLMSNYLPSLIQESALNQAYEILPLMLLIFVLMNVSGVLLGSLQGLHFGYISSQLGVFGSLIQLGLVVLLVPDLGLLGLAWAQVVQYSIVLIVGWLIIGYKLQKIQLIPSYASIPVLKEMLSFSLKAQVANISNGLFEPLSKILVSFFGGLYAQGIYELAYKTVAMSRNAITAGLMASLPANTRLIEENVSLAKQFYQKVLRKVIIASVVVLGFVSMLAPAISYVWIGSYDESYWLFVAVIASGFIFNTIGAPAYNLGLASGKMKNNIIVSLLVLLVLLTTGFILGSLYQEIGVVISVGVSLMFGGLTIKFLNERDVFFTGV